jgi:2-iminobutanoate/2-iminopropanoate deaminase
MSIVTTSNRAGMHTVPAFSQGTMAGSTVYVGGQHGIDAAGAMVEGGLGEQSKQALRNVLTVLDTTAAVGTQ